MIYNHAASTYAAFNRADITEVEQSTRSATKNLLKNCPNDIVRAERMLLAQIIGEAPSPNRYKNIQNDESIQYLVLLTSNPEEIVNDSATDIDIDIKTSAAYGNIAELLESGGTYPLQDMQIDGKKRGFYLEVWNNNIPWIDEDIVLEEIQKVASVIQRKYPAISVIRKTSC